MFSRAWHVEPGLAHELCVRLQRPVRHPARAPRVPLASHLGREVEQHRHRWAPVLSGAGEQVTARCGRQGRRIGDGQQAAFQAIAHNLVEKPKGVVRGALIGRVVGDERAARVAGDDLIRLEVAGRPRALARARAADQDDQRVRRQIEDERRWRRR